MKKLLSFAIAISLALTGMAQGNHKEKGKKNKSEKHSSKSYEKNHDDHDDDDDYNQSRKRRGINEGVYQEGKYSKNLPAKVRAAFRKDYPNARNVSWTKTNGYWTATFPDGAYQTSATYSANGQKINGATTRNAPRRTTTSDDGSIWDKILSKQ